MREILFKKRYYILSYLILDLNKSHIVLLQEFNLITCIGFVTDKLVEILIYFRVSLIFFSACFIQ